MAILENVPNLMDSITEWATIITNWATTMTTWVTDISENLIYVNQKLAIHDIAIVVIFAWIIILSVVMYRKK